MARVAITVNTLYGSKNPANPGADITYSNADATNDHYWALHKGDRLLAKNTLGSGQDVTIVAVADPQGRTENAGPVTVGANAERIFGPFDLEGWQQSDGTIHVDTTAATSLKLVVLRG